MKDTWVQVADALARRLARHATCQQHDSVRAGAAHGCPACADITALRRFERHYLRARGTPFVLAQTAAADYDVPLPLDDEIDLEEDDDAGLLDRSGQAPGSSSRNLVGARCQTPSRTPRPVLQTST